eukprot:1346068-Heterocapsa_arctica.AAC.1
MFPTLTWLGGTSPLDLFRVRRVFTAPRTGGVKTQRIVAGVSTRWPRETTPEDDMVDGGQE